MRKELSPAGERPRQPRESSLAGEGPRQRKKRPQAAGRGSCAFPRCIEKREREAVRPRAFDPPIGFIGGSTAREALLASPRHHVL